VRSPQKHSTARFLSLYLCSTGTISRRTTHIHRKGKTDSKAETKTGFFYDSDSGGCGYGMRYHIIIYAILILQLRVIIIASEVY
jgi:hypothetical protein